MLGSLLLAGSVWAHGGVEVEADHCIMKIGTFKAHFTGYQPEKRAAQEFCEDIPEVGNVIMVMDFINDELRDYQIDFRIVRDTKNIGVKATYADLGTAQEIENATVFYRAPALYPTGTISINHAFAEGGNFIGVVIAKKTATGETQNSVFPFAVGVKHYGNYLFYAMLIGGLALAMYQLTSKTVKKQI